MFTWLNGDYAVNKAKSEEVYIHNFDQKEGKFLVENDDEEQYKLELKDLKSYHHFTYIENWEEKLYKQLIEKNELSFQFWSLESGDTWNFNIKRIENELTLGNAKVDYLNKKATIVNYVVAFCDEIRGEIFSTQKENESLEKFTEWIESQMEELSLFNNANNFHVLEGITMETSLMSDEEIEYIFDQLS